MTITRRLVLPLVALAVGIAATAADKATALFSIEPPMLPQAKIKITTNLRQQRGVAAVEVSVPDNTVAVTYNPDKTDTREIADALLKIGFNATQTTARAGETKKTDARKAN